MLKSDYLSTPQFKPAPTNVAERCSTMPLLPVALVGARHPHSQKYRHGKHAHTHHTLPGVAGSAALIQVCWMMMTGSASLQVCQTVMTVNI